MANHFGILALRTPVNSMTRQKDGTLKDELPKLVGPLATGDELRNNSRKIEEMDPKQKRPIVGVTGDGSKVQWEQYCTGSRNVRSMNQGKLEMVKKEMARVNINILGISELK